jgi:hypothetical protein
MTGQLSLMTIAIQVNDLTLSGNQDKEIDSKQWYLSFRNDDCPETIHKSLEK